MKRNKNSSEILYIYLVEISWKLEITSNIVIKKLSAGCLILKVDRKVNRVKCFLLVSLDLINNLKNNVLQYRAGINFKPSAQENKGKVSVSDFVPGTSFYTGYD